MPDNALVADTTADAVRRIGIKLAALAQDGLTFATGDYDLDRYRQVSALAAELLAVISGRPAAELAVELGRDSGYATPKIDVRGAIFDDREQVLLMREKIDGRFLRTVRSDISGGQPAVAFSFNEAGGILFGELTGKNVPSGAGSEASGRRASIKSG